MAPSEFKKRRSVGRLTRLIEFASWFRRVGRWKAGEHPEFEPCAKMRLLGRDPGHPGLAQLTLGESDGER